MTRSTQRLQLSGRSAKPFGMGLLAAVCLGIVASPLAGCGRRGPSMGSLDGTVEVDGTPLDRGFVTLSNARAGTSVSADINGVGAFHIPSIPVGVYRVGFGDHVPSPEAMEQGARFEELPVHDRYRSPTTSGIEHEIKQGRNTVAFRIGRE